MLPFANISLTLNKVVQENLTDFWPKCIKVFCLKFCASSYGVSMSLCCDRVNQCTGNIAVFSYFQKAKPIKM